MRRCGAVGCVDMPDWDVSQVTDAHDLFSRQIELSAGHHGWTFADNADTTGMFTGADTWLSRASRDDTVNTTDGPPGAWVFNPCLENERVENGLCAPCSGGGTRAAGDDPALGVDTGCTFPDRAALKTAVDNCLAVDPTGVACCSHGADCGAAGTAEMPDWDVSLVTSMSELFKAKHPSTRIYRDGTSARLTSMYCDVLRCRRVQPGLSRGTSARSRHAGYVLRRQRSTRTIGDGTSARSRPWQYVRGRQAFNQDYRDGTSARSRPWRTCSTTPTRSTTMPVGLRTHPRSRRRYYVHCLQTTCGQRDSRAWRVNQCTQSTRQRVGAHRKTRATRPTRPSTATSATAPTPS